MTHPPIPSIFRFVSSSKDIKKNDRYISSIQCYPLVYNLMLCLGLTEATSVRPNHCVKYRKGVRASIFDMKVPQACLLCFQLFPSL